MTEFESYMQPLRVKPKNAQIEPPYPGDPTVVFAMSAPNMTAHLPTKLCPIADPHETANCREWNA